MENYGLSGKPTTVFFTGKGEKWAFAAGNHLKRGLYEKIPKSR
jgi:hypothetical protein